MTDQGGDRRLIAEFCNDLRDLVDAAEELGIESQLRAARLALAAGSGVPAEVVRQFQAAAGLAQATRAITILGQDPMPPPAGDFVCPGEICDRRAEREPGGPVPRCDVYGCLMRYQPVP
jgi:hypothetical protein